MKKGQTEIIGFMVIILILFFGLIFYFKFANQDSTDLLGEAEQSLEVSNLLNSIKKYTVCSSENLGDAIKSCASSGQACGEDACILVKREVGKIVELNGWETTEYMFYINEELYSPSTCVGNSFADDYTSEGVVVRLVYCTG